MDDFGNVIVSMYSFRVFDILYSWPWMYHAGFWLLTSTDTLPGACFVGFMIFRLLSLHTVLWYAVGTAETLGTRQDLCLSSKGPSKYGYVINKLVGLQIVLLFVRFRRVVAVETTRQEN